MNLPSNPAAPSHPPSDAPTGLLPDGAIVSFAIQSVLLKGKARALAEAQPPKRRMLYAQAFCKVVLAHYWEKLRPRCRQALRPAPFALGELRRDGLALAVALADAAASVDVDEANYLIGRTYAAMLPDEFRAKNGVYYTPPVVVRRLLDSATVAGVDWARCRAIDPSCGNGAFLGPLARRMLKEMKNADRRFIVRNLTSRLSGYELDPFAAWMSAVFLDATLNEEMGFVADESFKPVEVCDSLSRDSENDFDLVVGNPPFGRVSLPPAQRAFYKRSLYGHANLYGLFLDLALRKVRQGGVIAYVTPTSFLGGEYFKNLRALLAKEAPPVAFDFIAEREGIFDDVLQETLLTIFRRGASSGPAQVAFAEMFDGSVHAQFVGASPLPVSHEQPWIVPRSPSDAPLAARLRTMPNRLADWGYHVSTGPLVWNRYKDRLRSAPEPGAVPLLWAEAVGADGEFSFRAARRNHAPYFAIKEGDDALLVRRPCVLLQRTTAKEQPRRLVAAELRPVFLEEHGAVTVENHLNMVVSMDACPRISTRALAAFLNSAAADRAFRCISGTVAVSAYELESMPLPPPYAMDALEELLLRAHTRADIEAYCNRLYQDQ